MNSANGSASTQSPPSIRVPAVERSIAVLETLAASVDPLSFGELATRIPFARSSLHDVCSSLVGVGLVERNFAGQYTVGLKLVELARRRLASMEIVSVFQSVCRSAGVSDTIVLSVMNGPDVIYVSFIDGTRPLAVKYEIGMRLPAAFTASGKAMLATMSEGRVKDLLPPILKNEHGVKQTKPISALLDDLAATRNRGYSIDDEETALGMTCIGAPVFGAGAEEAVGAIAISLVKGATGSFDTARSGEVSALARQMSAQLGADRSYSTGA